MNNKTKLIDANEVRYFLPIKNGELKIEMYDGHVHLFYGEEAIQRQKEWDNQF